MELSYSKPEKNLSPDVTAVRRQNIILYNDDVNLFDYVIETLIKICGHNPVQAEQCALIAHFNGKCAIKEGLFEELVPVNSALHDCGLTAEIAN